MNQVLKAVYNVLNNDSSVTDLVDNIYPIAASEKSAFPLIVYNIENTQPHPTKSGASTVDHYFVSVDCYAKNTSAINGMGRAADIAEAVRTALDRVTPTTYGTINIGGTDFITGSAGYDKQSDVFVFAMEFKFRVQRAAAMHTRILTTNGTYVSGDNGGLIILDASSNSVDYALPATPANDTEITIFTINIDGAATVTATGGKTLNDISSSYQFREAYASIIVQYVTSLGYWILKAKE